MKLRLGIKSDPVEYRYSFPWLFRLMADEGVTSLQLGSFFEIYQLPDDYFVRLKKQAGDFGITIDSLFTAHRELGGFFREDPEWIDVARRNYERFIEIGALVGATSVGSNPGAVPRDLMGLKEDGICRYTDHMKELMQVAYQRGVEWLTIEPMSCLAEPPTLPDEIQAMGDELTAYHNENKKSTAKVGYCTDIAHGYLNGDESKGFTHVDLFKATLPWLYELHLKNTDQRFSSTFGFEPANLDKGIVDVAAFRKMLLENADAIPVETMGCYLEISGPKLGRDYSDTGLEQQIRQSLQHLKENFMEETAGGSRKLEPNIKGPTEEAASSKVLISPSMMCVDPLNFESALRQVEALGADMLHMDVMDGHFVPNAPMGVSVIEALKGKTNMPVDVHLMVDDNDFFVGLLEGMNIHRISVHVESSTHLDRTLSRIRDMGCKAGVALNPATPLETIDYILERIDYVLVMTVNPGFASQKMTPGSIRKIRDCRKLLDSRGYKNVPIQVDGNVSFENIPAMVSAGGRNLVAGTSSIFHKSASWKDNLASMRDAIASGLEKSETV